MLKLEWGGRNEMKIRAHELNKHKKENENRALLPGSCALFIVLSRGDLVIALKVV